MGQAASSAGLSEVVADAVSAATLCPGALSDGNAASQSTDSIDEEWTTVTVADATASAEDFLAALRRDLERTLVVGTSTTTSSAPAGSESKTPPSAPELSSVVPNSVLIRLALLQPFMRGASVFDALSFADKPARANSTESAGFRLSRPTVTLNGVEVESISAFREALQTASAAAIDDAAERHAVQQVLLLLVHNRFSRLCVDAAKLAFGDPSLTLAPARVDVTCVPGQVSLLSLGALTSRKREPPSPGGSFASAGVGSDTETGSTASPKRSRGAVGDGTIAMTLAWSLTPLSTPVTAWSAMASCFRSLRSGADEFDGQRAQEAAAVVTFSRHARSPSSA
eukprot:CAMPEP_0174827554 /NCGR_PEP_ID=MMETSP1114-20130205/793_1 /TAXON_ID=312471 /ORGANISM="Neobodo designis, Strain CCAP 1951/1" /LENGTH=339 /DNA_ID=CAMNT_0016061213 /DNA_START=153 /DNA_END=1172 /DNA_ORIENTATION=+